jgi:hypothetical protein
LVRIQAFRDIQGHQARAACGQRVDAQLIVVALGGLEQRRIDTGAHDVLEHLLAPGLLHRHRSPQLAVDVEGETRDGLPGAQRELELTFEVACVRVEELDFDARLRDSTHDLRVNPDLPDFDGSGRFRNAQHRCDRLERLRNGLCVCHGSHRCKQPGEGCSEQLGRNAFVHA